MKTEQQKGGRQRLRITSVSVDGVKQEVPPQSELTYEYSMDKKTRRYKELQSRIRLGSQSWKLQYQPRKSETSLIHYQQVKSNHDNDEHHDLHESDELHSKRSLDDFNHQVQKQSLPGFKIGGIYTDQGTLLFYYQ